MVIRIKEMAIHYCLVVKATGKDTKSQYLNV